MMKRFCPLRILRKKLKCFHMSCLTENTLSGVEVSSQHIRELSTVTCSWYEKLWPKGSKGNCWENSEDCADGNTMSLFPYIPTMLSPDGSHSQPSELVFRIFLGENHLPLAPWEPDRVPRAEALIPDRIQMLLECGRGQRRSVEASRQHWLIGVRIKLGLTFPDCDPSFCLIFFPPNALTIPSHRVCCHGVSRRLCFRGWDGTELSGLRYAQVWHFASPLLSFNEVFYFYLTGICGPNQSFNESFHPPSCEVLIIAKQKQNNVKLQLQNISTVWLNRRGLKLRFVTVARSNSQSHM